MQFCPRCGSIMKIRDQLFVCDCGKFEVPSKEKKTVTEKQPPKPELKVLMSEINPLAVYDHKCPKCGFEKAQIASKGIQYTDEDEDVEFVCGKCGYHDKAEGLRAK